jgi:plastocyanin
MRTTGPAAVTAAIALVTGLSVGTGAAVAAAGPPPPQTIVMKNITFYPRQITAKPGSTWTEDNEDSATHNVATDGKNPETLKAADVAPGKKATFTMPTKPGKYHLVCNYHPSMKITLTIK